MILTLILLLSTAWNKKPVVNAVIQKKEKTLSAGFSVVPEGSVIY